MSAPPMGVAARDLGKLEALLKGDSTLALQAESDLIFLHHDPKLSLHEWLRVHLKGED